MARLRIRIELSRGGQGVPLHKVASVISKSQKFLDLLSEDVHIDGSKGEWLGFDFDRESLNFTAEYVGAVTTQQVQAFNAAFDGDTSLRRDTIAQFASITDAIGEDEIVGFGLYQNDDTAEPTEWRCLSRRDALRIAEGIQMLLGSEQESRLPAARDPNLGARIFGDRREWSAGQGELSESMRQVEKSLSTRIQRVERQVEQHSGLIQELHAHSATTEASFRNLLSTVESFCNQATRRIERVAPVPLPASFAGHRPKRPRNWAAMSSALVLSAAIVVALVWIWPVAHPAASTKKEPPLIEQPAVMKLASPEPIPVAPPVPAIPKLSTTRIDLEATSPAWISLIDQDGNKMLFNQLLAAGASRTFEVAQGATLRTGNAGGLILRVNGHQSSPLGASGQIRQVQIKDGQVLGATQALSH